MTREEILAMRPGRELDAVVAEKVMGWKWISPETPGNPLLVSPPDDKRQLWSGIWDERGIPHYLPFYSIDISAAWEVFLVTRGWLFSGRRKFMDALQTVISHERAPAHSGLIAWIAWPDVLWFLEPHHICKASLLAVMFP